MTFALFKIFDIQFCFLQQEGCNYCGCLLKKREKNASPFPGSSPMIIYSKMLKFLSNLGFYVMPFEVGRLSDYLGSVVAVQQFTKDEMVFACHRF